MRHWASLAKVCGVPTVDPTAEGFKLHDMMKLNLHLHVEEVQEVVETAQKEKKIEKKLGDISGAWAIFELEYVKHKDTEMSIIKLSEEVIEALDAHMLELQTMLGMGKFVEFFRAGVEDWQVKLSNVQVTIKVRGGRRGRRGAAPPVPCGAGGPSRARVARRRRALARGDPRLL